jgi:GAF domain-containing protein
MSETVLCVDGDPQRRTDTEQVLSAAVPRGTEVVELGRVEDVREFLDRNAVDCLVTEYDLPDGTGLEAATAVRETVPDAGCVLYTGRDYDDIETTAAADTIVEVVSRNAESSTAELGHLVSDLLRLRTHTAYPVAADEKARVAAVARYAAVIDDAIESLDRLRDLALAHLGTSAAFVSLIDAREQRYLSAEGFPVDRLPRQETVCTYTLFEEGVTVIEDLRADPVFAANERLEEADLRAYAGVELQSPEGHVVGTLCVMDEAPRSFEEDELAFLRTLADEAMATLDLHRRLVDVEAW